MAQPDVDVAGERYRPGAKKLTRPKQEMNDDPGHTNGERPAQADGPRSDEISVEKRANGERPGKRNAAHVRERRHDAEKNRKATPFRGETVPGVPQKAE